MRSAKINLISLNFFIVEIVNIENVKIEWIANVVYCVCKKIGMILKML